MKIFEILRCTIKFLICILIICIYILLALILFVLLFLFQKPHRKTMSQLNRCLAGMIRRILGIKVVIEGRNFIPKDENIYIISNHLTYLDGITLGSLFPVLFVSKREVKSWPLFGQMASLGATIFIDRSKKNKARDYVHTISDVLEDNVDVLVFPEGTSTDGKRLLPFQTVFFNPPIKSAKPILPIAISYLQIDNKKISEENKNLVYWYGKMPFLTHLWEVLKLRKITMKVKINHSIDSAKFKSDSSGRKELSNLCHNVINKAIKGSEKLTLEK